MVLNAASKIGSVLSWRLLKFILMNSLGSSRTRLGLLNGFPKDTLKILPGVVEVKRSV